jgi:hypothetical protein
VGFRAKYFGVNAVRVFSAAPFNLMFKPLDNLMVFGIVVVVSNSRKFNATKVLIKLNI